MISVIDVERASDNKSKKVEERETITLSLHNQKERGTRIYISNKELQKIREKYGDDFFLFNGGKVVAQIDPVNETMMILPVNAANTTSNHTMMMSNLDFVETLEQQIQAEVEEEEYGQACLDFFIPITGTGEKFWIAEVVIGQKLCFYAVAPSKAMLEKDLIRKAKTHFPGLLETGEVEINYFLDSLVHSPVPGMTARNAFKNLSGKKVQDVEIDPQIAVPNDADLTPLVDVGEGKVEGLEIKKRKVLAKYEILALAEDMGAIQDAMVKVINGRLFWRVMTDRGEVCYDIFEGIKLNPV